MFAILRIITSYGNCSNVRSNSNVIQSFETGITEMHTLRYSLVISVLIFTCVITWVNAFVTLDGISLGKNGFWFDTYSIVVRFPKSWWVAASVTLTCRNITQVSKESNPNEPNIFHQVLRQWKKGESVRLYQANQRRCDIVDTYCFFRE